MNNLSQAIWAELLKVRRSSMPLLTALAFAIAPLAGGFFMVVLKDPDLARRLGLISVKAQIVAGAADWSTLLGMLAQATAIGGFILFSFICSWVFGREYADRTVVDLLALPTSREAIVLAKFALVLGWSAVLTGSNYLLGLAVGQAVGLPPAAAGEIWRASVTIALTGCLTIPLAAPIAFFASAGRGYLPPMGAAILAVILAQLVAAAGWGEYFPWSVPALYAGVAGPDYGQLGMISYLLVFAIGVAGVSATFAWWRWADQTV